MTEKVGAFKPETARIVLEVMDALRRSGAVLLDGQKFPQNPAQSTPIYFRNDSGETIPKFACFQSVGTVEINGQNYVKADKPADRTGEAGPFLFNLFEDVEDGEFGVADEGPEVRVLGASLAAGSLVAPTKDSWELTEGGSLASVIGDDDIGDGVIRVLVGGSGQCQDVQFEIESVSGNEATGPVLEVPCGCSVVPGIEDGKITAKDTMGCLVLDAGLIAWAKWVQPYDASDSSDSGDDCYWSIYSICCP